MPTALVLRHLPFEDLGGFAAPIAAAGYTISTVDAPLDELAPDRLDAADLLVVLGGPIGAYQGDLYPFLHRERAALADRLARGAPTLGVCLGAQLMAAALGAEVAPGPGKEIGWAPVTLSDAGRAGPLRHLEGVPVLHWHGDAFALPAGAQSLASTALCPHQAFAIGTHALGFQFHPEVDGRGFEHWLVGHSGELAAEGLSPVPLREDARRFGAGAGAAGGRCVAEWLAGLRS